MALTIAIAVRENTVRVRCVAFVTSSPVSKLVGLHNIKFWAPVTTNLVGITVLERILVVVNTWHQDGVKCGDTATPS